MPLNPPVQIDPAHLGTQPPNPLEIIGNAHEGPFSYGGNLYIFLATQVAPPDIWGHHINDVCEVLKSTDDGVTWVALGNAAPHSYTFKASFNGDHTVTIVYKSISVDILGNLATVSPAFSQHFDLATETWGAAGAAGFDCVAIEACTYFVSGVLFTIYIYSPVVPTGPQGTWRLHGNISGIDFQIDTQTIIDWGVGTVGGGDVTQYANTGTVVYCNYSFFNDISGRRFQIYQEIDQTGLVGLPYYFDATVFPVPFGGVAIYGNNIVLPAIMADNSITVIVGTPLANPVWSLGATIDPGFPTDAGLTMIREAYPFVYSGMIYILYVAQSPNTLIRDNRLRLLQTVTPTIFASWSATTIFDGATLPAPWVQGAMIGPWLAPDLSVGITSEDPAQLTQGVRFYLSSGPPPPPPPPIITQAIIIASMIPVIALPNPAAPNCR